MTDDCDQKPKFYGQEVRDQHALAIGRIAMAWNELHEVLAEIFGYLFNENDYGLALTAWHSLASDAAVKRHPELPPLGHEELHPPSGSRCRLKVGSAADGTEGGGADRRAVSGGRLDEAALSLGAEPIAVAADGQHVAASGSSGR